MVITVNLGKITFDMNQVPEELRSIVSQKTFSSFLSFAIDHLTRNNYKNIHLEEGLLRFERNSEKLQVNFTNLLKHIIARKHPIIGKQRSWKKSTGDYLDNFFSGITFTDSILSDFSKAKTYLTVRLHSQTAYTEKSPFDSIQHHVYRIDIPDTYIVLALDLPNTFHLLTKKQIEKWGIAEADLFEIARTKVGNQIEKITAKKRDWNGVPIVTLFDGDYSAAYCSDFRNNCDNIIGEIGSLVAFPTKGSVFVHMISSKEAFSEALPIFSEQVNKFYTEDPGPITNNLYWFDGQSFIKFDISHQNGAITYTTPHPLVARLNAR